MVTTPKAINYQAAYLWQCPGCGATWQTRHRPRGGSQLVCTSLPEQRFVPSGSQRVYRGCGSLHVSAGRRGGIAPNVSI